MSQNFTNSTINKEQEIINIVSGVSASTIAFFVGLLIYLIKRCKKEEEKNKNEGTKNENENLDKKNLDEACIKGLETNLSKLNNLMEIKNTDTDTKLNNQEEKLERNLNEIKEQIKQNKEICIEKNDKIKEKIKIIKQQVIELKEDKNG